MTDARRVTALQRVWAYGDLAGTAIIIAGAAAAIFVGRIGAALMLLGLATSVTTHLVVGVVAYRGVMAREWPKVQPLDDDSW